MYAQKKSRKSRSVNVTVVSSVTDAEGTPLSEVLVSGNEGRTKVYTSEKGQFSIEVLDKTVLLFEKDGYETMTVDVDGNIGRRIVMESRPLLSGEDDILELPQGIITTRRAVTGSVSSIRGEELMTYPDLVTGNALAGKLSGLTVVQQSGGLGSNSPEFYVRGYSTTGNAQAVVLVDGLERPFDDLLPEEIESVSVLKDAAAKILYGPRAANGVVFVKTKRGQAYKRSIDVSVDCGIAIPVAMPKYLDAAQYAVLYNEACENDGLKPYYSQEQINGYASGTGMNDLKYPDVDYYNDFLRKTGMYRKATLQFMGGGKTARYVLTAAYIGGSGLEKVGDATDNNTLSIRANLDVDITDFFSAYLDVAGRVALDKTNSLGAGSMFGKFSTLRPNEYPITLVGDEIDSSLYGDSVYGTSLSKSGNVYTEMAYGGYSKTRVFTGYTNVGFNLDASKFVNGLKAKVYFTLDNYSSLEQGQTITSALYAPIWYTDAAGNSKFELINLKLNKTQGDIDINSKKNYYDMGYYAGISYDRIIGDHDIDVTASWMYWRNEKPGSNQDVKNSNLVLRAAYGYKDRYYIDVTGAMMGSGRFAKGNRQFFSPAVGLGWIMSEESWFKNNIVNYLKLRGSFGILGYDANTSFYLYDQRWKNNGDMGFGNDNSINIATVGTSYAPDPNLKWEKSREFNIGVDAMISDARLGISAEYFNEYRYDIIQKVSSHYQTTQGHLIAYENWGAVANQGIEAELSWNDRHGDFEYGVGFMASWSKSRIVRANELNYTGVNADRSLVGRSADYINGYVSSGLFGPDFNRADYPVQAIGAYGAGDIRYVDMNNDGIVDDLDKRMIGNSHPRTILSLDIDLKWKGFGLYVLGTAHLGFDQLLTSSYYWNRGNQGYSEVVLDRWHPVNNPGGTYPRLTTTNGTNNFSNSDFWIKDASFFRLKNVELSYTFTNRNLNSVLSKFKVYVRGTNLFSISGIKGLDPEVIDGGVTNYPLLRNIVGGIAVTF